MTLPPAPPPAPPPPRPQPAPAPATRQRPTPTFVPRRPGVGFIIGMVLSGLAGLAGLLLVLVGSVMATGSVGPLIVAILLAILPVPILVGAVLAVDRLEPEPIPELAFAFVWGAGAAALLAAIANTLGLELLAAPLLGAQGAFYATATFIAPLTEETLKGVVLVGFLFWRRHHVDSYTDGIIYAAMVALGFAMTENITYYVQAFIDAGGGAVAATFIVRGIFSPLAHPLFTSMIGLGVAYTAMRPGGWWAPVVGWIAAMLLHGMWNGLAGLSALTGDPASSLLGLLLAYGVLFVVLVVLVVVIVRDRRRLIALLGQYLPGYVASGVVTPHDIQMLGSMSSRRAARRMVRQRLGKPGGEAVTQFQRAATDLALLHRRVHARVADPADAEPERAWLLGQLRESRSVFAPALH